MPKFTLGSVTFKTKKAATDHIREIIANGPVHEPLDDPDGVLTDLFERHPNYPAKVGPGIDYFFVAPVPGSQCLHVMRTDGTSTDFSYKKCLAKNDRYHYNKFAAAARVAILPQIVEYRDAQFAQGPQVCAISGVPLVPGENVHVDHHEPQFVEILRAFIDEHEIDPKEHVEPGADGQVFATFTTPEMEELWAEYHRDRAVLRLLCVEENMRRPRA